MESSENTIGEIQAALKEINTMQQVLGQRVIELNEALERESDRQAEAWPVPDHPAIEVAYLDEVTRKCSLCATRHPESFVRSRLHARILGVKPPHENASCYGCHATFANEWVPRERASSTSTSSSN